jgi:hypothetical protein
MLLGHGINEIVCAILQEMNMRKIIIDTVIPGTFFLKKLASQPFHKNPPM